MRRGTVAPGPTAGDFVNGSELGERARPERDLYTVSRLNVEVRSLLEDSFPPLWVEGEISNLARPRSGHLYFSLKDDAAQVRCAMFRMHNRRLDFDPGDGVHVVVHARVSLYAERGDFQLIVHHMEEAGAGALRRAFEALKRKLAAEGLFDPERKRELPALPSRIGVVTSPTGAALRDVLSVLKRRFPAIPVLIYPTPVQGGEAAAAIERAVELAGKRADCDVLLLTRGGGSLEDLWPFNEERVARALAACPIPIVTGIGHEVDFTIADLVADRRAATPSAAAELVSPDASSWRERRDAALRRLRRVARGRLREERQALAWLLRRVIHPRRRLAELRGRHRELGARLDRAARAVLLARRQRLSAVQAQLARHDPSPKLGTLRRDATTLLQRMRRALDRRVGEHRQRLASLMRALEGVSPSRTLERGYAIVTRDSDGSVLRDADDVARGDSVQARLARGRVRCEVLASEPEP